MTALYLTNARLIDGTGASPRESASVFVEDGEIVRIGSSSDAAPEAATVADLAGRTLLPGLVDAHVHVTAFDLPSPLKGEARIEPEVKHHFVAAGLREMLRHGNHHPS